MEPTQLQHLQAVQPVLPTPFHPLAALRQVPADATLDFQALMGVDRVPSAPQEHTRLKVGMPTASAALQMLTRQREALPFGRASALLGPLARMAELARSALQESTRLEAGTPTARAVRRILPRQWGAQSRLPVNVQLGG